MNYLYEELNTLNNFGALKDFDEEIIRKGLSKNIELRDYQCDAFKYFINYFENDKIRKGAKIHNLFHMATGSGKTVIMAGLILYLFTQGYKRVLFFVNDTTIIAKTKKNFTDTQSPKYLFNNSVNYKGKNIKIKGVSKFSNIISDNEIQICFMTTSKLHSDLALVPRENNMTEADFKTEKVVFIADESHHINADTRRQTKEERESLESWEQSVMYAYGLHPENIMLEFTATCELKNQNIKEKYADKIVFNFPLSDFRENKWTKEFKNLATDTEFWDRILIALIVSEYRKFLFNDYKINIKPVVMLKSYTKKDSTDRYEEFFENLKNLTETDINRCKSSKVPIVETALEYFYKKGNNSYNLLIDSLKNSFSKEKSIIIDTDHKNDENQIAVNTMEDKNNPYRIIFTVDMLNEGWDILNLYDIVRLYDTRQAGKGNGSNSYTIKEAQLIGRGARYCPFKITEEQEKNKRKYDNDLTNECRVLETLYYHCYNESRYISEITKALTDIGFPPSDEKNELILKPKETFLNSDIFNSYIFTNNKEEKDKTKSVVDEREKNREYEYHIHNILGKEESFFGFEELQPTQNTDKKVFYFKDMEYHILSGAAAYFSEFNFSEIKKKFPNCPTLSEFLTGEAYFGNVCLKIYYADTYRLKGKDIFNACKYALSFIAKYLNKIKEVEYIGTKEFYPKEIKNIVRQKSIYLSKIVENGEGTSQNACSSDLKLDLSLEDWYVYNDNYGTNEEKSFVRFFYDHIKPELDKKQIEYYLLRNERFSELAIYNFDTGERFEPDFVLLVRQKFDGQLPKGKQVYIEPKGENLLDIDEWKEKFLTDIEKKSDPKFEYTFDDYKIFGLPFYNQNKRMTDFKKAVDDLLKHI